jgi:hypothetical protein
VNVVAGRHRPALIRAVGSAEDRISPAASVEPQARVIGRPDLPRQVWETAVRTVFSKV